MKLNAVYTTFNNIKYYPTQYEDYLVSQYGRVLSIKWGKKKLLKPFSTGKYLCVNINRKSIKIHTLMADTFLGDRSGKQVNHKDGNKSNNHKNNLELVTDKENVNHAFKILKRKPSFGNMRITQEQKTRIIQYKDQKLSNDKIGLLVGFSGVHIGRILKQL